MRQFELVEHDFHSMEQVHAWLACNLDFPAYYGGNLAALSDCLGDIATPTRIVVERSASDDEHFDDAFDRLCRVLARCGAENDALDVVIRRD
jgi:RNAse (barnase) inhibitor barstar